MAHEDNLSIGIFIDGGYYSKINEGLKGGKKVNMKGLFDFICSKIAKDNDIDPGHLYITESHYYRGRYRATYSERISLQESCLRVKWNSSTRW